VEDFAGHMAAVHSAAVQPSASDGVIQYVFPVEIEVRSIGTEVHRDELVDAALAALVEELSAI
jgi:hypothetical protein